MFDDFSFFPDIDLYYDKDIKESYDLIDELASNKNLEMVASVYDCNSAKVAEGYCSALKIASTNITNFPLIECICKHCNHLVIDTGNATNSDIENVLKFVKKISLNMRILLQYSPTRPPMSSSTWNMWRIQEMQEKFKTPVGLSDHDNTTNQALLSLGLGVLNIEKGIMSDRAWNKGVSDSAHCIPISKLDDYLSTIITARNGLQFNPDFLHNADHAKKTRSGLYAKTDIEAGSVIIKEDLVSLIPEMGVKANEIYNVVGLRIINKIQKGDPLDRKNIRNY